MACPGQGLGHGRYDPLESIYHNRIENVEILAYVPYLPYIFYTICIYKCKYIYIYTLEK